MLHKLTSKLDQSINYVEEIPSGKLESRFVHREGCPYFIVYLSSQTGCDQLCRMCHLTATGQINMRSATVDELVRQAHTVLQGSELPQVDYVHFNFMARGEPLNNWFLKHYSQLVLSLLSQEAQHVGLSAKFLVSTIMPESLDRELVDVFDVTHPHIYYSMYSMRESFRRRWLPKAMNVHRALEKLKRWHLVTDKQPRVHYAFIRGENDDEGSVREVCQALLDIDLALPVNIVRYNPYSPKQGEESSEEVVQANAQIMREMLGTEVRVIPKVGWDVKASCGMFMSPLREQSKEG